ncbi:hypothetical protein [Mycolicibacterium grossiae]|uniref:Uncharacterized protein n=1 Tax=Mycolicibacterium grossiae TaxID=1552759 RepID=A0A1E8PXH4_9MYCO|nr:hypothetical protein [Mycolicibacterium grossiae]OFJ50901.1 hypothetical protein BEL07_25715 [Mycolicibacterium grossiae]
MGDVEQSLGLLREYSELLYPKMVFEHRRCGERGAPMLLRSNDIAIGSAWPGEEKVSAALGVVGLSPIGVTPRYPDLRRCLQRRAILTQTGVDKDAFAHNIFSVAPIVSSRSAYPSSG